MSCPAKKFQIGSLLKIHAMKIVEPQVGVQLPVITTKNACSELRLLLNSALMLCNIIHLCSLIIHLVLSAHSRLSPVTFETHLICNTVYF